MGRFCAGGQLMVAVSLHAASVRSLTRRDARHRSWERALLAVHAVGYLTAVFWVLSPVKAGVFIIVQQGLLGLYLGCSFAPTTRACPSWPPLTTVTSCVGRCAHLP